MFKICTRIITIKKMTDKKRDCDIHFRCTQQEKKKIVEYANQMNLSVSEYMLRLALKKKTIASHKELLSTIHTMSIADNKLENNINQIAHRLNSNPNISINDLDDIINLLRLVANKRDTSIKEIRKIYKLLR